MATLEELQSLRRPVVDPTLAAPALTAPLTDADYDAMVEDQGRKDLAQTSPFSAGLDQGLEGLKASGYGILGKAQAAFGNVDAGAKSLRRSQEISQAAQAYTPENLDTIQNAWNSGQMGRYAAYKLGAFTPDIAATIIPSIATGGVAGLAQAGIRGAAFKAAAEGVGERAVAKFGTEAVAKRAGLNIAEGQTAEQGTALAADVAKTRAAAFIAKRAAPASTLPTTIGQQVGAVAGGTYLNGSSNVDDLLADPEHMQEKAQKALVGDTAAGALNALPGLAMMARYGIGPAAAKALAEKAGAPMWKRIMTQAAEQGAIGGATSPVTVAANKMTHNWIMGDGLGKGLVSSEALSEYMNAAAEGALGGAVFGAPAGLRGKGVAAGEGEGKAGLLSGSRGALWNQFRKFGIKMPGKDGVKPGDAVNDDGSPITTPAEPDAAQTYADKLEGLQNTGKGGVFNVAPFHITDNEGGAVTIGTSSTTPLSKIFNPEWMGLVADNAEHLGLSPTDKLQHAFASLLPMTGWTRETVAGVKAAAEAAKGGYSSLDSTDMQSLTSYARQLPEAARGPVTQTLETFERMTSDQRDRADLAPSISDKQAKATQAEGAGTEGAQLGSKVSAAASSGKQLAGAAAGETALGSLSYIPGPEWVASRANKGAKGKPTPADERITANEPLSRASDDPGGKFAESYASALRNAKRSTLPEEIAAGVTDDVAMRHVTKSAVKAALNGGRQVDADVIKGLNKTHPKVAAQLRVLNSELAHQTGRGATKPQEYSMVQLAAALSKHPDAPLSGDPQTRARHAVILAATEAAARNRPFADGAVREGLVVFRKSTSGDSPGYTLTANDARYITQQLRAARKERGVIRGAETLEGARRGVEKQSAQQKQTPATEGFHENNRQDAPAGGVDSRATERNPTQRAVTTAPRGTSEILTPDSERGRVVPPTKKMAAERQKLVHAHTERKTEVDIAARKATEAAEAVFARGKAALDAQLKAGKIDDAEHSSRLQVGARRLRTEKAAAKSDAVAAKEASSETLTRALDALAKKLPRGEPVREIGAKEAEAAGFPTDSVKRAYAAAKALKITPMKMPRRWTQREPGMFSKVLEDMYQRATLIGKAADRALGSKASKSDEALRTASQKRSKAAAELRASVRAVADGNEALAARLDVIDKVKNTGPDTDSKSLAAQAEVERARAAAAGISDAALAARASKLDAGNKTPLAEALRAEQSKRAKAGLTLEAAKGKKPAAAKSAAPINVYHGANEAKHLSNLATRAFEFGGHKFHSVEHAYQSLKSGEFDKGTFDKYTGGGRKIPGNKGTRTIDGYNIKLMKDLIKASFEQNPKAREALLATGDAPITHTQDRGIWREAFPKALMEVREELRAKPEEAPFTPPDLHGVGKHGAKDQAKSNRANKFIGRGSAASATARYAKLWGDRANSHEYSASDRVFVSAEGNRGGRVAPNLKEIDLAVKAGATIITDKLGTPNEAGTRSSDYNVGEKAVAAHLESRGYEETKPGNGEWKPKNEAVTRPDMDEGNGFDKESASPKVLKAQIDATTRDVASQQKIVDALSKTGGEPEPPRVDVGKKDGWTNQNAQQSRTQADRLGLTRRIEGLFAEGKTAKQVVEALSAELKSTPVEDRSNFIVQVRATLDIPSRGTAEGKVEFATWKKGYDARRAKNPDAAAFLKDAQDKLAASAETADLTKQVDSIAKRFTYAGENKGAAAIAADGIQAARKMTASQLDKRIAATQARYDKVAREHAAQLEKERALGIPDEATDHRRDSAALEALGGELHAYRLLRKIRELQDAENPDAAAFLKDAQDKLAASKAKLADLNEQAHPTTAPLGRADGDKGSVLDSIAAAKKLPAYKELFKTLGNLGKGRLKLASQPKLQKIINGLTKAFGIEPVEVRMHKEGATFRAKVGNVMEDTHGNGVYLGADGVISIREGMTGPETVSVLMHEFGHHLETRLFSKLGADSEMAKAIHADFEAWKATQIAGKGSVRSALAARAPFFRNLLRMRESGIDTSKLLEKGGASVDYALDFHEYFADSVARALFENDKSRGIIGETFAKIAHAMKMAFDMLRGHDPRITDTPESFKKFVHDSMQAGGADSPADAFVNGGDNGKGTTLGPDAPKTGSTPSSLSASMSPRDRVLVAQMLTRKDVFDKIIKAFPERAKALLTYGTQMETLIDSGFELVQKGQLKLTGDNYRGAFDRYTDSVMGAFGIPSKRALTERLFADAKENGGTLKPEVVDHDGNVIKRYDIRDKVSQEVLGALRLRALAAARSGDTAQAKLLGAQLMTRSALAKVNEVRVHTLQPIASKLLDGMDERMRNTGIPALRKLAAAIHLQTGEIGGREDLVAAASRMKNKYGNAYSHLKDQLKPGDEEIMLHALRTRTKTGDKRLDKIIDGKGGVRELLENVRLYLKSANVKVGKIEDYWPVHSDIEAVQKNADAYRAMLARPELADGMNRQLQKLFESQILRASIEEYGGGEVPKAVYAAFARDATKKALAKIKGMEQADKIDIFYRMAASEPELSASGVTYSNDSLAAPGGSEFRPRVSQFIYDSHVPDIIEQFAKFQTGDMDGVMLPYLQHATRRAEFSRRMIGERLTDDGKTERFNRLDPLFARALKEGATPADMKLARQFVDASMGVLGTGKNAVIGKMLTAVDRLFDTHTADTNSKTFQRISQGIIAYQNVRLMGLGAFGSFIDPLGVWVRSAGTSGSFNAYREAWKAMRADKDAPNALRDMAESLGLVERHALSEAMSYGFGGVDGANPSSISSRINAAVFKLNGMEGITKFSRLAALSMAHKFLLSHSRGESEHSARFLKELNIKASDIVEDPKQPGFIKVVPDSAAEKAIFRFVDESVLRPAPTQRPGWMNDPHFAVAAQFKGYLYSFYNTIVKRMLHEAGHGNIAGGVTPMIGYIGVTVAAELAREMVQYGFAGNPNRENWGLPGYTGMVASRIGVFGPKADFYSGAANEMSRGGLVPDKALTGPSISQAHDLASVAFGDKTLGYELPRALPGESIYSKWF